MYIVHYTTPRGEPRCWATRSLGAELLRPVVYRIRRKLCDWMPLERTYTDIYVEVYKIVRVCNDVVWAEYDHIERSNQLAGLKKDPARLPA